MPHATTATTHAHARTALERHKPTCWGEQERNCAHGSAERICISRRGSMPYGSAEPHASAQRTRDVLPQLQERSADPNSSSRGGSTPHERRSAPSRWHPRHSVIVAAGAPLVATDAHYHARPCSHHARLHTDPQHSRHHFVCLWPGGLFFWCVAEVAYCGSTLGGGSQGPQPQICSPDGLHQT